MIEAVLFAWEGTLVDEDEDEGLRLAATTHALLESLRRRGLKLAVLTAAGTAADVERLGVAERVDRVLGAGRFAEALDELGVEPYAALFVGDRLREDVLGAGETGLTTVQALWFRADEGADGVEPDFMAFTQMDVLNVVDRLNRE